MAQNNPYRVPNGVYFKPSDSQIVYYLDRKNGGLPLPPVIEEFDIYTCSPDELIGKFQYGKEELYFFVPRNLEKSRKERIVKQDYGFWRSTGNNKNIYVSEVILQKRPLDFCTIIAKGKYKKTHWKMHEYSLASESSSMDQTSFGMGAKRKKVGFVLCKIYENKKASDENQEEEEQMTEMSIGDGPSNSDSDAVTENFEESTSLPFDENQMTEMPPGDGPNNPDLPSFGCHASMGDLLPVSEENQITEMPLRVGPNNPDFLSSECDANIEDWSQGLEENQITEMPLGDNPNNPNFPPFEYASMEIPEENQMTEIPLGHDPDNLDFPSFGWDANMEDSFRTFPQMTEMLQGDYPNNADFIRINMEDINMEDPFSTSEESQMTRMPLGDVRNNPSYTPSWGNIVNQVTEMSSDRVWKISS